MLNLKFWVKKIATTGLDEQNNLEDVFQQKANAVTSIDLFAL